jgi:hypothetical protein
MKTLKISLIATAIATAFGFWAAGLGLMHRLSPRHPQFAGFLFSLAICIAVQVFWPKEWLEGQKKKG